MGSKTKIVAVLGPFHGGTSAVTGVIRHLGGVTGACNHRVGYPAWENDELVHVCRNAVKEPQMRLVVEKGVVVKRLKGFIDRLAATCYRGGTVVIKHPSLCMMIPELVLAAKEYDLTLIDVLRPIDKVHAGMDRAGWWTPANRRLAVQRILEEKAGRLVKLVNTRVIQVQYAKLIDDKQSEVTNLAALLGLGREGIAPAVASLNLTPIKVWSYWEGAKPSIISLCQKTQQLYEPKLEILTRQTWNDIYWKEDKDVNLRGLMICQKADFIRLYLLKHYGGIWIDADCIVMRSFSLEVERLTNGSAFAYHAIKGNDNQWCNAFMGSRPNGDFINKMYEYAKGQIKSRNMAGRNRIGPVGLKHIAKNSTEPLLALDKSKIMPYHWHSIDKYYEEAEPGVHESRVDKAAWTYMLTMGHYNRTRGMTPEQIMSKRWFISHLFRRALHENWVSQPVSG